jgi:plasmid stabilization system protein ParE
MPSRRALQCPRPRTTGTRRGSAARRGQSRPEDRPGYFVYHVKSSMPRVTGRSVQRPRHLIVFTVEASDAVLVAPVVHEREMLKRHLEN